ncbi:MAG: heavy metal-binding domain-containing protein [Candidatus Sericytochromatia bacterium]|nr:heavy metal-binding domain-containing protein [Candidatus Sericytochromatia bacterium]
MAALILLGFWLGRQAEQAHLISLETNEAQYQDLVLSNSKALPVSAQQPAHSELISASVVIASDAFKNFLATLISILGGRIDVYEALRERARREALLRLRAAAAARGAQCVINVRIETHDISLSSVEAFAYGTALRYHTPGV